MASNQSAADEAIFRQHFPHTKFSRAYRNLVADARAAGASGCWPAARNERDCPYCNFTGTAHCGDPAIGRAILANGGEFGACSNALVYGKREGAAAVAGEAWYLWEHDALPPRVARPSEAIFARGEPRWVRCYPVEVVGAPVAHQVSTAAEYTTTVIIAGRTFVPYDEVPSAASARASSDAPAADWSNRRTDTIAGWLNELLTLADHRAIVRFARDAMRTIARGLAEKLAQQPILAGHTQPDATAAFEWLRAVATAQDAPREAGIALDLWHHAAVHAAIAEQRRQWLGPHRDAAEALDELRKAIAEMVGADPATWPDHGNAPLAIAAAFGIRNAALVDAERYRTLRGNLPGGNRHFMSCVPEVIDPLDADSSYTAQGLDAAVDACIAKLDGAVAALSPPEPEPERTLRELLDDGIAACEHADPARARFASWCRLQRAKGDTSARENILRDAYLSGHIQGRLDAGDAPRDALRYRWLRTRVTRLVIGRAFIEGNAQLSPPSDAAWLVDYIQDKPDSPLCDGPSVDRAIDAAIEALEAGPAGYESGPPADAAPEAQSNGHAEPDLRLVPVGRCSYCNRETVNPGDIGRKCGFPQPNGPACLGRFLSGGAR